MICDPDLSWFYDFSEMDYWKGVTFECVPIERSVTYEHWTHVDRTVVWPKRVPIILRTWAGWSTYHFKHGGFILLCKEN